MAAQATKPTRRQTTKRPPPTNKEIVADLVLNKGITQDQAAQLTGITQGRISQILSDVRNNPDTILFGENKDKVFEGIQARLLTLANDDLLKTMLSKRGLTDVAILEDKIRLIRGQATDLSAIDIRVILDHAPQRISSNNLIELENNNEVKQLKE